MFVHTHTRTHIYVYVHIYVCVCVHEHSYWVSQVPNLVFHDFKTKISPIITI